MSVVAGLRLALKLGDAAADANRDPRFDVWVALKRLESLEAGGSVLPMYLDDGSTIVCDSIAGGANSTDGVPNELHLRVCDADGRERVARFVLATVVDG